MAPHYDPEVTKDDIRSLKRFIRSLPGVSSHIVSIRYVSPDRFQVTVTREYLVVDRDEQHGWKVVDQGIWMT